MEELALVLRVIIAVTFLHAGLSKLPHRAEFAEAIRGYALAPEGWSKPLARWLPIAELAAGALLALGLATRFAAAGLAILLAVFTVAVAINLLRGRQIDCGCSGPLDARPITWLTTARNAALATAAVILVARPPATFSVDALLTTSEEHVLRASDGIAIVITVLLGLLASALWSSYWRLAANVRRA